MYSLPITLEEVRRKLTNILVDLSLEMIDATKEKMDRLHHIGLELEDVSHKLMRQKFKLDEEDLHEVNEALDTIFNNLVLEEAIERLNNRSTKTHATNTMPCPPRSGVRGGRLHLLSLHAPDQRVRSAG